MSILAESYPLDLSSGSTEKVSESLDKISKETSAIYGHLNSIRTRYRGATAPDSPVTGMIWEDTANNVVKKYDGSAWVADVSSSSMNPIIAVKIFGRGR